MKIRSFFTLKSCPLIFCQSSNKWENTCGSKLHIINIMFK